MIVCASDGMSRDTVFDTLNGFAVISVRPTLPSCRKLRLFRFWPSVTVPAMFGFSWYLAVVVAALDEAAPRVGVRQVRADFEIVGEAVRAAEANRVPGILVVTADDDAVVVVLLTRQIERRAVVAAGDGQIVLNDPSGGVRFVGMVEDR